MQNTERRDLSALLGMFFCNNSKRQTIRRVAARTNRLDGNVAISRRRVLRRVCGLRGNRPFP